MPKRISYILAKLEMKKISIWKWKTSLSFGKVYLLIALKTLSEGSQQQKFIHFKWQLFSCLQIDIFCHFKFCHYRRNGFRLGLQTKNLYEGQKCRHNSNKQKRSVKVAVEMSSLLRFLLLMFSFLLTLLQGVSPLMYLHWIFPILQFEGSSLMNWIFSQFEISISKIPVQKSISLGQSS